MPCRGSFLRVRVSVTLGEGRLSHSTASPCGWLFLARLCLDEAFSLPLSSSLSYLVYARCVCVCPDRVVDVGAPGHSSCTKELIRQVEKSTEGKGKEKALGESNWECAICLEPLHLIREDPDVKLAFKLPCSHIYCNVCMARVLQDVRPRCCSQKAKWVEGSIFACARVLGFVLVTFVCGTRLVSAFAWYVPGICSRHRRI
jgi:hypothetical protein